MALTKNSYKEIKNGNVHKKEELLRKLKPLIIKRKRGLCKKRKRTFKRL